MKLREFIFVDRSDEIIREFGLADTEAAYKEAVKLANQFKVTVIILERIDTVEPWGES